MDVGLVMATLKAIPGGQSGASTTTTASEAPYDFAPEFEAALVYLVCSDREVYSKVGALLSPKSLTDASAKLLVQAAQAVATDLGEGPNASVVVVQRLVGWRSEGKTTTEQVQAAVDYLDAVEDKGVPPAEATVQEAARILKRREEQRVLQKAMEVYAKRGDFSQIAKAAEAASRIGEQTHTLGTRLDASVFDELEALGKQDRLPTGCYELDHKLGGGLPRGLTLFLGREKSGKSMVLSSVAAEAYWRGRHVAIATLELSEALQKARVIANVTGVPIDEILAKSPQARTRYSRVVDGCGELRVRYFAPETPVADITQWVERLGEESGKPVDLLIIDYIDLVGSGKASKDENDYKAQKVVTNRFRDHANGKGYVAISASQARRSQAAKGSKHLDSEDAADSMHKIRVPDLVIAMRMEADDKDHVDYFVTAARTGGDRVGTGPLPVFRAMGRMFPVDRGEPW